MKDVTIVMHPSYQPERDYICHVVFTEFFGLSYQIEWTDQVSGTYDIIINDVKLTFPDILFSTPKNNWLKNSSFPRSHIPFITVPVSSFRPVVPVIFGSQLNEGTLSPQDIDFLGTIFFLITRYEEMGEQSVDKFGRYDHKNSIAYKEGFLNRPIVNEYLALLKHLLNSQVSGIPFKQHTYVVSLSHDVDVPITFNVSWIDCVKKALGDFYYRRDPTLALKRFFGKLLHTITGSFNMDPNNNFDYLMSVEDEFNIKGIFNFIPIPGSRSLDSNYQLDSKFIRDLFQSLAKRGFPIGFHPSYDTFCNQKQTKRELDEINRVLSKVGLAPVEKGRHHYLRWKNPETWQIWNELQLREDSSLGYGLTNGFRSGCCYKYSVFDLVKRSHLELMEEPLIFMDVNCDVNSKKILDEVSYYASVCKFFGGNFTILYHNNYVISRKQKEMFREVLRIATSA